MAKENSAYVFIHLGGQWVPCGYLTIIEDRREILSTFQYGRKYLQRRDAIAVDPVQLPLGEDLFRSRPASPLFGAIRDTSPDGWGRHLLARAAEPRSPGEFEYLTALPVEDRTGALGFGRSIEEGPAPIDPGWPDYPPQGAILDLGDMIAAVDRIDKGEALAPRHRRFLLRGSSLGALNPKRRPCIKAAGGSPNSGGSMKRGTPAGLNTPISGLPNTAASMYRIPQP
jgi:serine/threonine-protein kinase HipA